MSNLIRVNNTLVEVRDDGLAQALSTLGKAIKRRAARKAAIKRNSSRLDEANEAFQNALREGNDR